MSHILRQNHVRDARDGARDDQRKCDRTREREKCGTCTELVQSRMRDRMLARDERDERDRRERAEARCETRRMMMGFGFVSFVICVNMLVRFVFVVVRRGRVMREHVQKRARERRLKERKMWSECAGEKRSTEQKSDNAAARFDGEERERRRQSATRPHEPPDRQTDRNAMHHHRNRERTCSRRTAELEHCSAVEQRVHADADQNEAINYGLCGARGRALLEAFERERSDQTAQRGGQCPRAANFDARRNDVQDDEPADRDDHEAIGKIDRPRSGLRDACEQRSPRRARRC